MARAKRQKYAATREMQSIISKEGKLSSERYTTDAKTVYTIKDALPDEVHRDIAHAIDEVLHYYSL